MDKTTVMERLNAIFQDIFDDETIRVTEETTAADIEDWDSLAHITLIATIEKEFQMKFTMDEVGHLKNVGEMASIVMERAK